MKLEEDSANQFPGFKRKKQQVKNSANTKRLMLGVMLSHNSLSVFTDFIYIGLFASPTIEYGSLSL